MVAPIWSLRLSWHLPKWCKGKSVDSFEEWLTTQMFGMTATGGSEIDYNLVQYSESQWFRMVLERVGLPITPKPAMVLVDQFEELLKRFPRTRDNLARVIFVCNSDAGSQTLLNLNQGARFDRVIAEQVSGQGVIGLDMELFQKCSCNFGMYKLVEDKIARQELTEEQVEDFLDFHLPYPVKYDRSWAELDVELMKKRMEEPLEQALRSKEKDHRRGDQASDGLCRKDIEGSQPATDLGRPRGAVGGDAGECQG
ncbi:Uncharacterized protein SCF082_LOCUS37643 [Durusdinium trenchii]|uniref:Uncharacterized protein n=1 Tax=Durusdinium trenchii TaxID=1381693 RepID=A0ABP0PS42_9DINO